ncbi:MAG: decarboxylating NADP(+)-dependent phosphogluconate dehydrogenase [Candidatus Woesearchaeota archaeon]
MNNFGLIGLAVMGENLVLNIAQKGFSVSVYNRTTQKVDDFVKGRVVEFGLSDSIKGFHSIEDFVASLESPRKIMLMVKAGGAVDAVIDQLVPLLDTGDIIIDGGNSNFSDSQRRYDSLQEKGIFFVGSGVSGGEEGALLGPSIMPGGAFEAWNALQPIFQKISAQVNEDDGSNSPCSEWIGLGGSGHFVKMVHNGIEYGDMQLISESYLLLKHLGKNNDELHAIFSEWNEGDLASYLIEITRDIFTKKDEETGKYVVDLILDAAGQKGTGKWTAIESLHQGIPLTLITEAVFARALSAFKEERVLASEQLTVSAVASSEITVEDIEKALFAAKIISYAQGFALLKVASKEYDWNLNFSSIAKIWRGGCIIRSQFLNNIAEAYDSNKNLPNLMLDDFFKQKLHESQQSFRKVVAFAVSQGIPIPALSSALSYFDGYRSSVVGANLIQAQRDFFGAHMYERIDKKRGVFFHTNWTGKGGTTTSNQYDV